jgi:hypothetical protein
MIREQRQTAHRKDAVTDAADFVVSVLRRDRAGRQNLRAKELSEKRALTLDKSTSRSGP